MLYRPRQLSKTRQNRSYGTSSGFFALTNLESDAFESVTQFELEAISSQIQVLMAWIRPHAVRLVDSWQIPDYLLDSALGRYGGRVYEDLFNRAHRLNPLNRITFNPNYWDEKILMGTGVTGRDVLCQVVIFLRE